MGVLHAYAKLSSSGIEPFIMRRIPAFTPVDFLSDGHDAPVQAVAAFGGILVQTGFVWVELVLAAILHVRHVGHDDICPCEDALFTPRVIQRLQGGGRGDIHIMQMETRHRNHF